MEEVLKVSSWSRPLGVPNLLGRKKVDWSVFNYGTHIPVKFHEFFEKANGGVHLDRGQKHDAELIIDGNEYQATLFNIKQKDKSIDTLHIRYDNNNDIKKILRDRLAQTYIYIKNELSKLEGKKNRYVKVPEELASYMEFFETGTPFQYKVEIKGPADLDVGGKKDELAEPFSKIFKTKEEAEWAFDLLRDAFNLLNVKDPDDPRFALTLPHNQRVLRLNFGSWAVLQFYGPGYSKYKAGIALIEKDVSIKGDFNQWEPFKASDPVIRVYELPSEMIQPLKGKLRETFENTFVEILKVFHNRKVSNYRKFNQPEIAEAVFDLNKREQLLTSGLSIMSNSTKSSWIFQANPEFYDLEGSLKSLKTQTWLVAQHKDKIHKGDKVYLWQSGPHAGIYAVAEVLNDPGLLSEDPDELAFVKVPEKFAGEKPRVRLLIKYVLPRPLSKSMILQETGLSNLKIITAPQGTNFSLTGEQARLLEELISSPVEPRVWWVNQGTTLKAEKEGGFLWAPHRTKAGKAIFHWDTMAEVNQGDIVLHYTDGAVRYVSKVLEAAVEAPKPEAIKEEGWSAEGRLVKVDYHELSPPIPLKSFADDVLQLDIHQGPLDSQGGVKQGYLFRFTPKALGIVQASQPETTWPEFIPDYREEFEPLWPVNPEYPLPQIAQDTGFPEEILARWVRAIGRKGQAIVYGPPGTGKTFIAEKLALHLIGGGNGFQELVQFHPAYSYEDFVQGIRPQATPEGHLDYPVVPGRFLEFCRKSAARKGHCVLIIDEINRANLSQVFGELMYLLEYRNREVPLSSGGMFKIPKNVRVIGTMNTADRSIALVDHALRRRFAFLPLYPDHEVLKKFHADTGFPVEKLIDTLRQLNNQIGDSHYEVGITFFLREDLANQIEDIWRMEIEPYLEEYFFDQPEKVKDFRWTKIQKQILP